MSTSPKASTWLQKPEGDAKISEGTFGYITARIRQRAYDIVIREFKKSGLTQAQLCRRWGKTADQVSRFLSRPGNWELNTFAEALFAISGAVLRFEHNYPSDHHAVDAPKRLDIENPPDRAELPSIPDMKAKSNNPNIHIVELLRAA